MPAMPAASSLVNVLKPNVSAKRKIEKSHPTCTAAIIAEMVPNTLHISQEVFPASLCRVKIALIYGTKDSAMNTPDKYSEISETIRMTKILCLSQLRYYTVKQRIC